MTMTKQEFLDLDTPEELAEMRKEAIERYQRLGMSRKDAERSADILIKACKQSRKELAQLSDEDWEKLT